MSRDLPGADMGRMSRAYEVQHLAVRVAACTERVETAMARIWDIQLLEWQSPAGRAYRNSVALQGVALGRAQVRLQDALLAVGRHAREVASSASNTGRY